VWASTFGEGMRKTLLAHRDGARMIGGTRLTNVEYLKTTEKIAAHLVAAGLPVRATVVLLSTIYNYTVSFVTEEQAVYPYPGERSPQYSVEDRNARLDPTICPLHRQASAILFERYDRRYREGLALILDGAERQVLPAGVQRD
jgi:TetR/AcrR family tetracycline transcriptional repressor